MAHLARRLEDEGLVRSARTFRWLVRLEGDPRSWKAGGYLLEATQGARGILAQLDEGKVVPRRLTVPEGTDLPGLELLVAKEGGGHGAGFGDLARQPGRFKDGRPWLAGLPGDATLEGYLFPDTYDVPEGTGAAERLLARMLDRFGTVAWPLVREGAHGLTPRELLTLASLVEREAVRADERPLIAGVFLGRLASGMRLGSDPTVEYVLGWRQTAERPLTLRDIAVESPYNTYRVKGLPPGPIANPGLASIRAVLDPRRTDLRFFVARGDGSHVFSRTHAEHRAAVRAVRQRP